MSVDPSCIRTTLCDIFANFVRTFSIRFRIQGCCQPAIPLHCYHRSSTVPSFLCFAFYHPLCLRWSPYRSVQHEVEASLVIILYQLLNKFKSLYSQLSSFIDKRPLSSPDASIKLRQDNQRFLPLSFCSDSRTIDTLECNGLSSFLPYLEI